MLIIDSCSVGIDAFGYGYGKRQVSGGVSVAANLCECNVYVIVNSECRAFADSCFQKARPLLSFTRSRMLPLREG